jgi:hypothetical protein
VFIFRSSATWAGVHFLARQAVDQKEAIAGEALQGQIARIQAQGMGEFTKAHPFGYGLRVFGISFVTFTQSFLEVGCPMRIEQVDLRH